MHPYKHTRADYGEEDDARYVRFVSVPVSSVPCRGIFSLVAEYRGIPRLSLSLSLSLALSACISLVERHGYLTLIPRSLIPRLRFATRP